MRRRDQQTFFLAVQRETKKKKKKKRILSESTKTCFWLQTSLNMIHASKKCGFCSWDEHAYRLYLMIRRGKKKYQPDCNVMQWMCESHTVAVTLSKKCDCCNPQWFSALHFFSISFRVPICHPVSLSTGERGRKQFRSSQSCNQRQKEGDEFVINFFSRSAVTRNLCGSSERRNC